MRRLLADPRSDLWIAAGDGLERHGTVRRHWNASPAMLDAGHLHLSGSLPRGAG